MLLWGEASICLSFTLQQPHLTFQKKKMEELTYDQGRLIRKEKKKAAITIPNIFQLAMMLNRNVTAKSTLPVAKQ